jgi:hypothetical protein
MAKVVGRKLGLSLPRRWVCELMRISRGVPLITIERRMNLKPLVDARNGLPSAPSIAAIFTKAYAMVAGQHAELRRAYMSWPWPHLFEAEQSFASMTIARAYHGEEAVFFGTIKQPDRQPLPEIHRAIQDYKDAPIETIRGYQRLLKYAAYPQPFRRFIWWFGYHRSGAARARNFGTFAVTVTAGLGATLENIISPLTTTLTYGPIADDGTVSVRLIFDHRVLDGAAAARVLKDLETMLTEDLVHEVWTFRGVKVTSGQ